MHKISLIVFLLFFSFFTQSRPTDFGKNCTNDALGKKLNEDLNFPRLSCFGCRPHWDGFGIPWQDDNFVEHGWTPEQVNLVVLTLNIDDKLKENEELYEKILDELDHIPPFSTFDDIWNFIKTVIENNYDAMKEKLSHITEENLRTQFQEVCQAPEPEPEEVQQDTHPDVQEDTPLKCCDYEGLAPPRDCTLEEINIINSGGEPTTGRLAWKVELRADINTCNPAVCCKINATEEKPPRYDRATQNCQDNERKATSKEDTDIEPKCKVTPFACCDGTAITYQEISCESPLTTATDEQKAARSCEGQPGNSTTEAGADCSSGTCHPGDSSTKSALEAIREEVAKLQEENEEMRRAHREEIEDLEAEREERDREYGEKREDRDRDNAALAADLSDCQSRSGNWSELSEANQKICGLLTRIHQRQDEIAKMQDYNQQVQQQLWQAVQSQSMNAFSQYESIHKMMRPGFFNSPYPGQNLQMMDQMNAMQVEISSLRNSMDQSALTSRFDQLVSRMDQMIQLNATGTYNSDAYYQRFRQDLLGVQRGLPNSSQSQRPILR